LKLEDISLGLLRRALRIYHEEACGAAPPEFPGSDGEPIDPVLGSVFTDDQKRVSAPLSPSVREPVGPRRYVLRLSCDVFQYSKFVVEEDSYLSGEFFFAVDTHHQELVQFAADEPGLQPIFQRLVEIKERIDRRWNEAGMPTMERLLATLEQRLARRSPSRNVCVLVVDDNAAGARHLELLLRSEGFDVDVAHDGQRALQLIDPGRHRLVVMDVQMPGVNGVQVVDRIKANPDTAAIPVLLTTAGALDLSRHHQAEVLLVKPQPVVILLDWIEHLLLSSRPSE